MAAIDIRDFSFWAREALRRRITKKADFMRDMRFANGATGSEFVEALRRLEAPLIPAAVRVAESENNWKVLRSIGSVRR